MRLVSSFRSFLRGALSSLGILLLLLLAVSGQAVSARAQGGAMVRVVHAAPAAGNVDVFVDGTKLVNDAQFGAITDYGMLSAGDHVIKVAPAGKGVEAAVITQTVTVSDGVAYTVAAIGAQASDLALTAFIDDNTLSSNQAKVRVYHLSPDAGPVNVANAGQVLISGLTYKNASDYLTVAPGAYTFDVTATDANASVSVSASLKADVVTSVFALGLLNGTPKLEFVAAETSGAASMPQTGSDPTAGHSNALVLTLWTVGGLLLLALGAGFFACRLKPARDKDSD